jgi:uncharacterized protein YndB with AHSA1/START domain
MTKVDVEFSAEIQAGAEKLWDILTDVQSWPGWQGTSYIKPVTPGPLKEGSKYRIELGGFRWDITVTIAERPHRVCWIGRRMGLEGVHDWEFREKDGKTGVITRESMYGWMLFLLYPAIKARLAKYDDKWLADLKSRAESH